MRFVGIFYFLKAILVKKLQLILVHFEIFGGCGIILLERLWKNLWLWMAIV